MSKLTDAIAARQPSATAKIDSWVKTLDSTDQAAIHQVAIDRAWTNVDILSLLAEHGLSVGKDAVAAWRARLGFRR